MDRRHFIRTGSLGLLAFTVGSVEMLLSPREARARDLPFQVLSESEIRALNTLGEVLLPGAADAGLAHYIDHQLAAPSAESLLIIRYLDIPPPYLPFYRGALLAADDASRAAHGVPVCELTGDQRQDFVASMARDDVSGWQGPPAGLVYFVLRNDAIDVVYGTQEGFAKLGFPYQPHIIPPAAW